MSGRGEAPYFLEEQKIYPIIKEEFFTIIIGYFSRFGKKIWDLPADIL